jgi:glycopeptide antibiotics resistance protein
MKSRVGYCTSRFITFILQSIPFKGVWRFSVSTEESVFNFRLFEECLRTFPLQFLHNCVTGMIQNTNNNNKKVKFSLEQAIKAQRESRGIALLFL